MNRLIGLGMILLAFSPLLYMVGVTEVLKFITGLGIILLAFLSCGVIALLLGMGCTLLIKGQLPVPKGYWLGWYSKGATSYCSIDGAI